MTPLRFAFLSSPLAGHLNPTLAAASHLRRAGHAVSYHLPERFRDQVEEAGASLVPYSPPAPSPFDAGTDPLRKFALTPIDMTRSARHVLPQVLSSLSEHPADVIVYDMLSVWGRLAAELLDTPAAMVSASYAMNDSFSYVERGGAAHDPAWLEALDCFAADMYALSRSYGTPRLGLLELLDHAEPLTIVFVPRELQPAVDTFDERYIFVGPVIHAWCAELDDGLTFDGRPLVYASLGTLFGDWPEFLETCCEAFSDGVFQVMLSGFEPPRSGVPGDILIRPRMPQLAILARAHAFITHGGMNSVMEAIHHGVPMVLVPRMPEQALTAGRISAAGAGIATDPSRLTPRRLRAAVEEVIEERGYSQGVESLRTLIGDQDAAAAAARAMVDYAVNTSRTRKA